MTLILTHITRYGIVHASDSNLTANGKSAGEGKKVFHIPRLNAGLSVAGSYAVGGTPMNEWMQSFIDQPEPRGETQLGGFAESLRGALQKQMRPEERKQGCFVHLAGYAADGQQYHPEFWYISNIHGIEKNGKYSVPDADFKADEEFWRYAERRAGWLFFNGSREGRFAINTLGKSLNDYMSWVWSAGLGFRPPQSLKEVEGLVKLQMNMVTLLFGMSSFPGPPIGGETRIYSIPPPSVAANQSDRPGMEARKCP